MLLSLTESNERRLKKRSNLRSDGVTQGLALMSRGYVIENVDNAALAKNHKWLGNNKPEEEDKKQPVKFLLHEMCLKTWSYGAQMATIIRQLMADLPAVGFLSGDGLRKQIGYAIIPRNQLVHKFYRSKATEVKRGKKTVTES